MNFLEAKIAAEGYVGQGNILKVDHFLNHQIDVKLIFQIAEEFKRRFDGRCVDKVLTIEASGIAIATLLGYLYGVPVVFAKKGATANCTDDKYMAEAYSFTHKRMNRVFVSKPYLNAGEHVLIVDDSITNGFSAESTIKAISNLYTLKSVSVLTMFSKLYDAAGNEINRKEEVPEWLLDETYVAKRKIYNKVMNEIAKVTKNALNKIDID